MRWAPWTSTAWRHPPGSAGSRWSLVGIERSGGADDDTSARSDTSGDRLGSAGGAAADVNAGDTVIVYSTARQGAATATVVIDHARVVRVVRPQATVSSGTGSFATAGDARSTSVVLDLDLDQAARLAAAAHTSLLDLAPVAPVEDAP